MSGRDQGRGHELARELAALRMDELLAPEDEAWLADHLDFCDACAAVAAEYDAQHDLFTDLRAWTPDPPRDLWARTAAKIDAERGRGAGNARRMTRPMALRLSLAPIAAFVGVVVVVSAGLLNSAPAQYGGAAGIPTPIALADTAAIQVIVQDSNGNLHLVTRPMKEVCPTGASSCGAQPTTAVTSVSGVKSATTLQGAISPSGDKMVVVAQDGLGDGVYVVAVRDATAAASRSPQPSASTPTPTASLAVASPSPILASSSASLLVPATVAATGSATAATASASASTEPSASPSASASPEPTDTATSSVVPASPSLEPSGSPEPSGSASDEPSPSATVEPSAPSPIPSTTPAPSVEVTPGPAAAIKIASGITVVGSPVYAPDGGHLAFAAMPSDGSTGPDIYLWAVGDKVAQAITTDHGSWLAGWTPDGILISRVADGQPSTFVLDPATGHATPIGDPGTWLPAVAPDAKSAAWWDGTLKLAADGVTWVPDSGRLVIGAWPNAPGSSRQALAKGQTADWGVRWSDDGSALAVWVDPQGKGDGSLSLYRVADGSPDLANPMLENAPANPGFSIRTGRLAWTTPAQTPAQAVQVLAWSDKDIVRLEVPADGSGTVLP